MLQRRTPYQDSGADYYDVQYKARVIRNLKRRAATLGMKLEPIPPPTSQSWSSFSVELLGGLKCCCGSWDPVIEWFQDLQYGPFSAIVFGDPE